MIDNIVIRNKNKHTGKKIIEFFKSRGVKTGVYVGSIPEVYYGVVAGRFGRFRYVSHTGVQIFDSLEEVQSKFSPKPQRGDRVLVWDLNEVHALERIFLAEISGSDYSYVTVHPSCEKDFEKGEKFHFEAWRCMKPIIKEEIVELTFQDISAGKGKGVPPHLLRIKE